MATQAQIQALIGSDLPEWKLSGGVQPRPPVAGQFVVDFEATGATVKPYDPTMNDVNYWIIERSQKTLEQDKVSAQAHVDSLPDGDVKDQLQRMIDATDQIERGLRGGGKIMVPVPVETARFVVNNTAPGEAISFHSGDFNGESANLILGRGMVEKAMEFADANH